MVATQEVLDDDVARVRRRIWVRRALGVVLGCLAVGACIFVVDLLAGSNTYDLVPAQLHPLWAIYSLLGLAFLLVIVGGARSSGTSFVGADDLLSRTDRAWLRTQITRANPVPDERRAVVSDAARRMIAEGGSIPKYVGLGVMFAVSIINVPTAASLVTFSALLAWTLAQVAQAAVWSRRARRWLAQNL